MRKEREKRKNLEWFFQNSRKQPGFHSSSSISSELEKMHGGVGVGGGEAAHFNTSIK